jgi:uncharacterized coiled-coil protein SlyX
MFAQMFRIDVYHHFPEKLADDSKVLLILQRLVDLETHMSKQDDAIDAAVAAANEKFTAIGSSLDTMAAAQTNIAADEAKILAELKTVPTSDLTPENQAKLNGVISGLAALADRSAAQATAFQTLADSLPDAPVA